MNPSKRPLFSILSAAAIAAALPAAAQADIVGFGNFSGFSVNQTDSSAAPTIAPGLIHLTNNGQLESRSVFATTPQPDTTFTASFTYQAPLAIGQGYGSNCGTALVFQESGPTVVGYGSVASSGISRSVALTLELDGTPSESGLYTNGANPNGSASISPINLLTGDPINVNVVYGSGLLQETLTDTVTGGSYSSL